MPASKVTPEIKAAALADLLAGDTPAKVAARYQLDPATVRVWKQRYVTVGVTGAPSHVTPDVTPPPPTGVPALATPHAIGGLLLDLLAAKLKASQAIARAAQDPAWLDKQSAADLAALGEYLDRSALALGDRLARPPLDDGGDDG